MVSLPSLSIGLARLYGLAQNCLVHVKHNPSSESSISGHPFHLSLYLPALPSSQQRVLVVPPNRLPLGEDIPAVVTQVPLKVKSLLLCLGLFDRVEDGIETALAYGFAFLPIGIDSLEQRDMLRLNVRMENEGGCRDRALADGAVWEFIGGARFLPFVLSACLGSSTDNIAVEGNGGHIQVLRNGAIAVMPSRN